MMGLEGLKRSCLQGTALSVLLAMVWVSPAEAVQFSVGDVQGSWDGAAKPKAEICVGVVAHRRLLTSSAELGPCAQGGS